jgi:hypothetical protein
VIYVEHHNGPEQTEIGRIDWRPGWYAICDDCGWSAGPYPTESGAHAAADDHDLAMGEATPEELGRGQSDERPAEPGERCTCGRQAIVVSTSAACSRPPATVASPMAATAPGRARSAAAPATPSPVAAARTTACELTSHDPHR